MKKRILKVLTSIVLIFVMLMPYMQSAANSLNFYKPSILGGAGDTKTISSTSFAGGEEKTGTVPPENTIYDRTGYYRYISDVTGIVPPEGASSDEIYIRELSGDSIDDVNATFYCLDPTRLFPPHPDGTSYTSIGLLREIEGQDLASAIHTDVSPAELASLLQKFYLKDSYDAGELEEYFEKEYKDIIIESLLDGLDGFSSTDQIYQYLTDDDIKVAQQLALWEMTSAARFSGPPKRDYNQLGDDDTPLGESGYKSDRNALFIMLKEYFETSSNDEVIYDINLKKDHTYAISNEGGVEYLDYGTFRIDASIPNIITDIKLFDQDGNEITDTNSYEIYMGDEAAMGGEFGVLLPGTLRDNRNNTDLLNHEFFLRFENAPSDHSIIMEVEYIVSRYIDAEIFVADNVDYQNIIKLESRLNESSDMTFATRPENLVDLSLRKFITHVNSEPVDTREPILTGENEAVQKGTETTAHYAHIKKPLLVKYGETIDYTIRVYNESIRDGNLISVADIIPKGLTFIQGPGVNDNWTLTHTYDDGRSLLVYEESSDILIEGATQNMAGDYIFDYYDIHLTLVVDDDAPTGIDLTNIAYILNQREVDFDSIPGNYNAYDDLDFLDISNSQLPNYRGRGNDAYTLDQPTRYYEGYEDDDDFEKVYLRPFDLALKKYITHVNDEEVPSREPVIDVTNLASGGSTTANYTHDKTPVLIDVGDVVTYKIRVYNEGGLPGYAKQIKDHIPAGLGFILNHRTNMNQGWTYEGSEPKLTEAEKSNMGFLTKVDLNNIAAETSPGVYSDTENATAAIEIDIIRGDIEVITSFVEDDLIPAFNSAQGPDGLSYIDVEIATIVLEEALTGGRNLRNVAEISIHADENNNTNIPDRDSEVNDLIPDGRLDGSYDDDEDYENLTTAFFDLALRKFITNVNDDGNQNTADDAVDREPDVNIAPLIAGQNDAIYSHPKTPVTVQKGDLVTYTIRVYNEGMKDGYVKEIKDHIPKGLAFLPQHQVNIDNGWVIESGTDALVSDYPEIDFKLREDDLDGVTNLDNTILAVNSPVLTTRLREDDLLKKILGPHGYDMDSVSVQIVLAVLEDREIDENEVYTGNLRNVAEISLHADEFNNEDVVDRDSKYDDIIPEDRLNDLDSFYDDEDYEDLSTRSLEFDLALQKFITRIESTAEARARTPEELSDRRPVHHIDENRNVTYTKENTAPPLVGVDDIVTYTIRIYNEGDVSGFAKAVRDNMPEGLTYLENHETNIKYQWYFTNADRDRVYNIEDAVYIETAYLSREAALEREANDEEPGLQDTILFLNGKDFSYRDIQVVFRVNDKAKPGANNLRNIAEIADDEDQYGNEVKDRDSFPANNNPNEDDIDDENLEVTYFDLALLKIVSNVELTENGKTRNIPTGHTFDMIPEPIVKTDLDERYLSTTQIKYTYKIRVFNEGLVEGYATKVADYIPEGLAFYAEDQVNNVWAYDSEAKGVIVTTDLADVLLKPGEYATVELVLRWINHRNNMGVKTNVAEIYEDYNEYELKDIDSTPKNRIPGEDDIDDASVLVAIRTGAAATYFIVTLTMAIIVGLGTVLIKRYIV